ncbi:MAG: hypothetical protein AAGA85_16410 [Bacteroidota bacterium]
MGSSIKRLSITSLILMSVTLMPMTFTLSGCARGNTVKVVKRKKHYGWYDAKKDRNKKRTKTVRYKRH